MDQLALLERVQLLEHRNQELEQQLASEKHRNQELEAHLRAERSQRVLVHHQVEEEEEYIVNKVVERLESLKHARHGAGQGVELENMATTLKGRLDQIHTRKLILEKQLESESTYVMGDLQTQLELIQTEKANLAKEKAALENALEAEQEYYMHKLQRQLIQMQNDKKALLNDKLGLQKTVHELAAAVKQLSQDKVDLEQTMEMEEEAFVNKLMRQLLLVMNNHKRMEKLLEMHGIRVSGSLEGSPAPRRSFNDRAAGSRPHSASLSASLCTSPPATPFQLRSGGSAGQDGAPFLVPTASGGGGEAARRDSAAREREARLNASLHSMGLSRRQDSSSSIGSGVSAMSRDVSMCREGPGHPGSSSSASAVLQAMQIEHPAPPPAERK